MTTSISGFKILWICFVNNYKNRGGVKSCKIVDKRWNLYMDGLLYCNDLRVAMLSRLRLNVTGFIVQGNNMLLT